MKEYENGHYKYRFHKRSEIMKKVKSKHGCNAVVAQKLPLSPFRRLRDDVAAVVGVIRGCHRRSRRRNRRDGHTGRRSPDAESGGRSVGRATVGRIGGRNAASSDDGVGTRRRRLMTQQTQLNGI